jgi:hypothetical protein
LVKKTQGILGVKFLEFNGIIIKPKSKFMQGAIAIKVKLPFKKYILNMVFIVELIYFCVDFFNFINLLISYLNIFSQNMML